MIHGLTIVTAVQILLLMGCGSKQLNTSSYSSHKIDDSKGYIVLPDRDQRDDFGEMTVEKVVIGAGLGQSIEKIKAGGGSVTREAFSARQMLIIERKIEEINSRTYDASDLRRKTFNRWAAREGSANVKLRITELSYRDFFYNRVSQWSGMYLGVEVDDLRLRDSHPDRYGASMPYKKRDDSSIGGVVEVLLEDIYAQMYKDAK